MLTRLILFLFVAVGGAFSVPQLPLTPTRIVGTILLLADVLLIQKR